MALPPKGDLRRPLHLAIRSMRLLGIVFITLGMLGILPIVWIGWQMLGAVWLFFIVVVLMFYVGPGILYIVCAIYLKRRRTWAVVMAIVIASLHLLLVLAAIISILISIASTGNNSLWIAAGILALFIMAFAQLIYHLSRSFESLKCPPMEEQRGFEPVLLAPPIPVNQVNDSERLK